MRKVEFRKFIPATYLKATENSYWLPDPGTGCYEEAYSLSGLFHLFLPVDNRAIAIVEMPDGTICYVDAKEIRFIS